MPTEGDARFRLMFERSADAVLLLDTSINKFVEYNQAALDMLRCSREELSVLHPSELSPPLQPDGCDSFSRANERIATAVRAGSHRFEWIHRSPHREDFPVEVLLTPIQVGEAPMLLVVWRDITERKRHEEALRASQKLESLGVLAGGVAHDFNNLLTAIQGHLDLARALLPLEHPAAEHLQQVERAVGRAADLSRQMLAYSGQGPLQVETVDLSQTVGEMVDLLRAAAAQGVRMRLETSREPLAIDVSRAELQQVVMNVVTNALEASRADGVVTVRTSSVVLEQDRIDSELAGYGLRPGRYAAFEVEDHGCGMSAEVLAKVFDPFFSTKGSGRGLGLSALVGIVRGHGGGLCIRTREGEGTRFTVVFPASRQTPVPAPEAQVGSTKRGEGVVLVVDDHPAIRLSTRALLASLGFEVIEAADGESAIRAYAQYRSLVRWVLMDLTMPGMNGYDAFQAIRRLDDGARVILSSGWAEGELAQRFRADPPLAFLPKPYRKEELEAVLHRVGLLGG